MKKISKLMMLLVAFMMIATLFTSCKKDKDSPEMTMVIVKRSNGNLYKVDKTSGDTTQIGAITYEGAPLTGLRCLIWDSNTGKAYAGSTASDNGRLYSIDLKTGVATLLNNNPDDNWDGIAGILVAPDDSLITNMYSSLVSNSALVKFDKTSGDDGLHRAFTDGTSDVWSVGGLVYGSTNSELIVGGDTEIYLSNLNGLVSDTIPLVPTTNINDEEIYVMTLAKDNSTIYGLFYEYNELNQYLVKLNATTGEMTEIKLLINGGTSALFHCLALVPADELP